MSDEETREGVETPEKVEASETKKASTDLKVVMLLQGSRAMVGIQSTDCDPIFTTFEGDMAAALSRVPALIESANAKWDASPRNPKANLPEPPPSATPARTPTSQSSAKKTQPSFF